MYFVSTVWEMMQQTIISGVKNHQLLQKVLQTPGSSFIAGISLSASTSECFEFASLQLPRFLAFLPLISFYYREDQGYPNLKLSTRTMGILVCLVTDLLWKFDGGYRR